MTFRPNETNIQMCTFTSPSCAPLSPIPSPLPSARLHWRSPASSVPAPHLYRPDAINLRSSAFICGLFFAGAPDSNDSDRIIRIDRINRSTNPVNPVHPVHSSFSAAPDINRYEFIKVWISQNPSPQSHPIHFSIRANPCNPCNPCSIVASLFAEAPKINHYFFINNRRVKYSSAPGIHIRFICALPSLIPSPLPSACFHWRSPAGSEPAPRCIKSSPLKRTRIPRIGRILTDFPISVNPRHPRNPCSTSASLFVDALEIRNAMYLQFTQTTNLRSSAFICGLFFAGAPDINSSEFIKVWTSQNFSPQIHPIHFSIRANPCSIVSALFSKAPKINCHLFIKIWRLIKFQRFLRYKENFSAEQVCRSVRRTRLVPM